MMLPVEIWERKVKEHEGQVSPYADAFLRRRSSQQTHTVHDFLFTYYSFSPKKLKNWVPSIDETLSCSLKEKYHYPWLNEEWFHFNGETLFLKKERFNDSYRSLAQFIMKLCVAVLERTPRFGCYGLHEWAMVYKNEDAIRHKSNPLRLSLDTIAQIVEKQALRCTHYDAYRFFTPEAKPLNVLQPTLESRLNLEQGGCVHVNMDLYKWATKLWPWIGSDFIAKTFFLALEAREIDMRASPYDLKELGYDPICIETEEGRKEYVEAQQQLFKKAGCLRKELKEFCEKILEI